VFKINCKQDNIYEYIEKYNNWVYWHNIYKGKHSFAVKIDPTGIPCFPYYNVEDINACESPMIAIDCVLEGLNELFEIEKYKKGPHYLIFNSDNWENDKVNLDISYDLVWHPYFLIRVNEEFHNPYKVLFYADTLYDDTYPKPLVFISTTGNVRLERDVILHAIKKNIRYNNFVYKYSGVDHGVDSSTYDVIDVRVGEFDPYINISNLSSHPYTISYTVPIELYNRAYFNLVVETALDIKHNFFVTEKIYKTISTGMPFVLVSGPHYLRNLRKLGFHTYNELWDESYDDEVDFSKRVDKIVSLCNDLELFDWEGNKDKLALVRYKNFENMLTCHKVMGQSFENFEEVIKRIENG
jgi:hypothetical protein